MRVPTAPIATVAPQSAGTPQFQIDADGPNAFGLQSAQAESALGGDLAGGADVLAKHALALQGLQNETIANDAQTQAVQQASQRFGQYRTLEGKAAVDGYQSFQNDISALRTSTVASLPNPEAKLLFDNSFRRYEDMMLEGGSTYAAQQNKQWMVQSAKSAVANYGDQAVLFRGDPAKVDLFVNSANQELQKQGELQGWDAGTLQSNITDFNGFVYRKVVDAMHTDDPAGAQAYYNSIKDRLGGVAQATIEADLKRGNEENSAIFKGDVQRRFQDNIGSLFDTGVPSAPLSAAEIHAAFGQKDPAVADHMVRQLQGAQVVGAAKANMGLTTNAQDEAMLDSFAPKPGADYSDQSDRYNNVVTAYNQKWKAVTADPAAYVMKNSPAVASAFQAAAKDPSQLPQAVAAMDGAYDQLGVPSYNRPVLPTAAAQGTVQSILANPDPAARATAIGQMQQSYGDLFPRIMGDLVKAKLPAAYEVLPALPNAADRVALAAGLGDGTKASKDALPGGVASAVDKAVESDPNLADLGRSMSYAAGGADKAAELTNVAKLIGYGHALGGAAPDSAASSAVASFTTNKYDFWDNGTGIARVPKGTAGDVERAADITLNGLQPSQIAIPQYAQAQGATPETVQHAALLAVKAGAWVTNQSDDGLVRIDSNGYPVKLANGQLLSLSFKAVKGIISAPGALDGRQPEPSLALP